VAGIVWLSWPFTDRDTRDMTSYGAIIDVIPSPGDDTSHASPSPWTNANRY